MKRNYKYLLQPNWSQAETIDRWSESLRLLYNFGLTERRDSFKLGKSIGYYNQTKGLIGKKTEFPRYKEIHSQVLQQTLKQLDQSFQSFFQKRSKYPKYKDKDNKPSILFPQKVKIIDNMVKFPKLGLIKVKLHRSLPAGAKLKQARLLKEIDRYYVVLSIEIPDPVKHVKPVNVIGCDVGVKHLATLSDGTVLDGEQPLKKGLARLARAQQNLSRKKTGSMNRSKQKAKVQRIHLGIKNARQDFLHKVSANLAETYDGIVFENMNLGFINRSRFFKTARKSYDLGIGTFRTFCEYKFAERGKQVFFVNPKNTTKECSNCGHLVPKGLDDRIHDCPFCCFKMDRDLNASINILEKAQIGREPPDFKPVEKITSAPAFAGVSDFR